ncbi:hypothetical protein EGT07_26750 [Herbaspirillum sp. HC18]|nr:hypothetical protein EGT07_26750 [Herbaspirillum sp. HC18]
MSLHLLNHVYALCGALLAGIAVGRDFAESATPPKYPHRQQGQSSRRMLQIESDKLIDPNQIIP